MRTQMADKSLDINQGLLTSESPQTGLKAGYQEARARARAPSPRWLAAAKAAESPKKHQTSYNNYKRTDEQQQKKIGNI